LNGSVVSALLLLYGSLIALVPVALHGAYRYRMAKTSWKGIGLVIRVTGATGRSFCERPAAYTAYFWYLQCLVYH
jgi:hypothetical protein